MTIEVRVRYPKNTSFLEDTEKFWIDNYSTEEEIEKEALELAKEMIFNTVDIKWEVIEDEEMEANIDAELDDLRYDMFR